MGGGPPSVLIVEDDSALRLLCRVNFELDGWRVLEAATLDEARRALPDADVVLLDLHVSREDGRPLLHESKRDRPERAVVILTGSVEVDLETRALADEVVAKPFAPDELVATALRALSVEPLAQQ
jgi:DNA-binding response OmpR family regulator